MESFATHEITPGFKRLNLLKNHKIFKVSKAKVPVKFDLAHLEMTTNGSSNIDSLQSYTLFYNISRTHFQ